MNLLSQQLDELGASSAEATSRLQAQLDAASDELNSVLEDRYQLQARFSGCFTVFPRCCRFLSCVGAMRWCFYGSRRTQQRAISFRVPFSSVRLIIASCTIIECNIGGLQVALKAAQKQLAAASEPSRDLAAKLAQMRGALEQAARDYKLVLAEMAKIREETAAKEEGAAALREERDALREVRRLAGPALSTFA